MKIFFADNSTDQITSWDSLIDDIHKTTYFNKYCYTNDYYSIFKSIIISLLLNEEIIVLDNDFSDDELRKLIGETDVLERLKIKNGCFQDISSKKDLLREIKKATESWRLTLFTSGTTGLPKKVSHSFQSITRFVKISKNHEGNIWGFAFNPAHIAGIQVYFQALLNGNSIIRLFGLSKEEIFKSINHYQITNISATPTFYRLLLPHSNKYDSVLRITSGGEKFDNKLVGQINQIFRNAKITNVYASTEAGTLFASSGGVFSVKPELERLIMIDDGELKIHKSLLGRSDTLFDEWYKTGDLVDVRSQSPLSFTFVSRKNEMINIGGYKVNPHEVEEALRSILQVKDCKVYSKANSILGNILLCEVVKAEEEIDEAQIRMLLKSKLQEYKIPRIIKFVDNLSVTRTGKISRL